jgi:hypothetical protein
MLLSNGNAVCFLRGESKSKSQPRTGHEGPEGKETYSSNLSLTSQLDGAGGQVHAPAALPPEKTQYPLHRRLGGSQSRPGPPRQLPVAIPTELSRPTSSER